MNFQIRFTTGERKGETFQLVREQPVSIGRSRSNTIHVSAEDVSGRHVIIRTDRGGNATVEILSSRISMHNGKSVNIGDIFEISDGDTIQMGDNTVFVIEKCDDDKTRPGDSDDEKTCLPQPSPLPSNSDDNRTVITRDASATVNDAPGGRSFAKGPAEDGDTTNTSYTAEETVAFHTRAASDDELDNIKKAFRSKYRKKILLIALPILLFFALAVFLYFYLRPDTEEFVSWPTDREGNYLNDFTQLAPYLALLYPKVPENSVKTEGAITEVNTRIGKLRDVKLHILAAQTKDQATLTQDHPQAFELWMEQMREKEPTLNFGGDRSMVFLNNSRGAGVPLSSVSYTRRVGNDDYWGYALFLRNMDQIHTFMIEVPVGDRWRAAPFMRSQTTIMVIYAIRRTEFHWEGTASYRKNTDAFADLREAASFMERQAPVYWGRIYYLIRSALIKSALADNGDMVTEAQNMLVKLRRQQTTWYSTQKLAYQYAAQSDDRITMNSIQATAESVFSSEFQYSDFRYDMIKRKDWQ